MHSACADKDTPFPSHNTSSSSTCKPESVYKCKYCQKSFRRASALQTHYHIHSIKKPFKRSKSHVQAESHQRTSSTKQILNIQHSSLLLRSEAHGQELLTPQYYRHHIFVLPPMSYNTKIYQHQTLPLARWEFVDGEFLDKHK